MNRSKCSLQISQHVIKENYKALCSASSAKVGASVKANSYGLGVQHIAPILKHSGCKHFFVSSCDEGVELRKILGSEANIYILLGVFKNELEAFLEYNLIPVLNHLSQIEIWQEYASKLNRKMPCILHIDTGMHRLGMPLYEIESLDVATDMYKLDILYIISHLAYAEDIKSPFNLEQLNKFKQYTTKFPGIKRSLANSSGVFLGENYQFDLVRPGAAIYGINPTPYLEQSKIKNPVKLFAPIIQVHHLPPGSPIGYNCTYINKATQSCPIATIPIGYADGFSRAFSNKGEVYINGFKAPVIGRVSMDLITIDVSNVPSEEVFLGASVEVIGDNCTPDKLAKISGTNSYEILTMLGDRYEKIYS
ncbi:MAG: alanine racemase [Rickettsiaceae bacterium]|nr:alanine racemase [Rickettsiaceae bacterium]